MSKADLVHLLEDSIEKTSKKRKDHNINEHCTKARRFIQKSAKILDTALNVTKENQPKLRRDLLNQREYEELHERNRLRAEEEAKQLKALRARLKAEKAEQRNMGINVNNV